MRLKNQGLNTGKTGIGIVAAGRKFKQNDILRNIIEQENKRMKSIKKMASEYAREFVEPFVLYYTKDEVRQFEAQHEDSFEAGANYVISCIEKEMLSCKEFSQSQLILIMQFCEQLEATNK